MTGPVPAEDALPIDRELVELRQHLGAMGQWALGMLRDGMRSLDQFDPQLAADVIARDDRLDRFDVELEQESLRLLVTRQPTARNIRWIASGIKAISYLDRIGRHGYDIARITRSSAGGKHSDPWPVLVMMAERVDAMILLSLEAFEHEDVERAGQVYRADDLIDELDRQVLRECIALAMRSPETTPSLFDYVRVSRALERAADNGCKIAEKTVYIATGKRRREFLGPDKHLLPTLESAGSPHLRAVTSDSGGP